MLVVVLCNGVRLRASLLSVETRASPEVRGEKMMRRGKAKVRGEIL